WRGADINNILDFEKDFPNTKTIRLEQNYRSTEVILEGASAVVANDKQRKGKTLWTSREGGVPIGYYEAPDGENEALFIADRIQSFLRQADDESRCAVLYRTNAQSRLMEESLRRYGIQYNMVGGFSFYDRAEVKDLLSYMKLVQNPHDSIALQRVINSPARGIGKTTLETLERMALATGMSTWDAIERTLAERLLPQRALTALSGFRRLIEDARAMMNAEFAEKLAEDVQQDTELSDIAATEESAENVSDTSFDFGFDAEIAEENLGAPLMPKAWVGSEAPENSPQDSIDAASFNPFINLAPKKTRRTPPMRDKSRRGDHEWGTQNDAQHDAEPAFRKPGGPATLPELIKFLNDRSGYIRALEDEGTPESFSRIENLKELANAAQDAGQRGETLAEFLDHAALASDTDSYSADARVTLMTLHAAKGLEFPLVFLAGMEEGLFPSGRTMLDPAGLEEERRLCYVGMTRAMNTLILTRARYRRRYGSDAPEQTLGSRFLEEIPSSLIEDLGSPLSSLARPQFSGYGRPYATPYPKANQYGRGRDHEAGERHWSYEDEDQRTQRTQRASSGSSSDNIANFFSGRGEKPRKPEMADETPAAKAVLRKGNKVWHPKYGEGIVFHRDSDGDDAKITVQFLKHGMKKLVERFAQLERL
ncbi:MAG: ATP-binding domain-containing protein, partial [Acidobacteriaceae bacterium]|nr:ATP-binding domain-containing protein [Acidobacteriaceae bacterium]